jgi:hypothetical protein
MMAKQRNAPTSLTLREHLCAARSAGHAMNTELFTLPWGIPREDLAEPEGSIVIRLGAFHCLTHDTAPIVLSAASETHRAQCAANTPPEIANVYPSR